MQRIKKPDIRSYLWLGLSLFLAFTNPRVLVVAHLFQIKTLKNLPPFSASPTAKFPRLRRLRSSRSEKPPAKKIGAGRRLRWASPSLLIGVLLGEIDGPGFAEKKPPGKPGIATYYSTKTTKQDTCVPVKKGPPKSCSQNGCSHFRAAPRKKGSASCL